MVYERNEETFVNEGWTIVLDEKMMRFYTLTV